MFVQFPNAYKMSLPPSWLPDELDANHSDSTDSPSLPLDTSFASSLFSLVSPKAELVDDSTIFEANRPSHELPRPAEVAFEIIPTTKPMRDPLYYLDTAIFEVCLNFYRSQMTDPRLRAVGG